MRQVPLSLLLLLLPSMTSIKRPSQPFCCLPACPPQNVYFVNSGSEANDLAMMMARAYTSNWDIVCLRVGCPGPGLRPEALVPDA
jgi:hypothetical protein